MLDAGLLTHVTPDLSPSMMVEGSMAEWFASLTRDLNWFEINLCMTNDHEMLHHDINLEDVKKQFGVESDKCLHFAVSFATWYWFTLKERVEALEAKVEGLGETAIHWLDNHVQRLCTAVTPNFTLYAAQYAYWCGEDDESMYLEECGEDEEIYARAEFDDCIPKIAHAASAKLDKDALQGLLSHPDREVADLAAMLLEPEIGKGVGGAYLQEFSDDHLPIMEPAICLAWSENDDTLKIIDDYFNMEGEHGNGTGIHAMWTVSNSAEGIVKARTYIDKFIVELKKIENVLSIVALRTDNI